jgi:hypothetical protein
MFGKSNSQASQALAVREDQQRMALAIGSLGLDVSRLSDQLTALTRQQPQGSTVNLTITIGELHIHNHAPAPETPPARPYYDQAAAQQSIAQLEPQRSAPQIMDTTQQQGLCGACGGPVAPQAALERLNQFFHPKCWGSWLASAPHLMEHEVIMRRKEEARWQR